MDEIDCCWLCWKSLPTNVKIEVGNTGDEELDGSRSRKYLDTCIKHLKLESENLDEITVELNNCPLCLTCVESAKKLTKIVDNLENLKRELDEYCSTFLSSLKHKRKCIRLENMKSVKNFAKTQGKHTLNNDDIDDLDDELISGDDEVDIKDSDMNDSDFEDTYFESYGGYDVEDDSVVLAHDSSLDKVEKLKTHPVKTRATGSRQPYVKSRRLKLLEDKVGSTPKVSKCSKCDTTFASKSDFLEHNRTMHKRIRSMSKNFKCEECGEDFPKRMLLKRHFIKSHQTERPYKCSKCQKCFKRKHDLQSHERGHKFERSYACNMCDMAFNWAKNLTAHKNRKHATALSTAEGSNVVTKFIHKEYHCETCGITIKSGKVAFENHKRLHSGEKPFKCDTCEEQFSTQLKLRTHRFNAHVNEYPFECNQCERKFKMKRQLWIHQRGSHPGPDQFIICEDCGKSFKHRNSYLTHRKIVHEKIKYKCEHCDRVFSRKSLRQFHIKLVHTKEVQLVCHICGKECSKKSNLQDHIRTHTGEKPYPCTECHKYFTSSGALSAHRGIYHRPKQS